MLHLALVVKTKDADTGDETGLPLSSPAHSPEHLSPVHFRPINLSPVHDDGSGSDGGGDVH